MRNKALLLLPVVLVCLSVFAADTVLTWPADVKDPIVKVTIGKLRSVNTASGQTDYVADATVENTGKKPLPFASFYLYLFDKSKKRVGEGYFELTNLGIGQQAKVAVTAHAMGTITSMELQPQNLPSDEPLKVKVNISTKPAGASFKVDSKDSGYTPQTLMLTPGKHTFEFAKEGYQTENSSIDITSSSLQSVNLELNPATQDTLVLRDGTVVQGDVSSVTPTSVTVSVKGKVKRYDRNQVARLIFVEHKAPKKPVPAKKK